MRVLCNRVRGLLCVCLALVAASWVGPALAGKPDPRPRRAEPHPDGEVYEVLPEVAFAGTQAGCPAFGNFSQTFVSNTPLRYRANKFRVDFDDVRLKSISAQLRILSTASPTLYFSVHQLVTVDGQPNYRRWLANDIQVTAPGNGTPTFYSTSPTVLDLGLALPRGEYAIGVAWSSTAVTFARDNAGLGEGLSFLHGAALARLSVNEAPLRQGDVPEADMFPSTTGLYSMELCFAPVNGACCVLDAPPDNCEETLPAACDQRGGVFSGQRTDCATGAANCLLGGCCDDCGDCTLDITPLGCAKSGGVWTGPGVGCPNEVCTAVTGACCTGTMCTPDVCQAECEDCVTGFCGAYLGNGTGCEPNFCSGACCVPEFGCVDVTRAACTVIPGTFKGEGRSCAALARLSTPELNLECGGACCHKLQGEPRCSPVQQRSLCSPQVGLVEPTYMGDASVCQTNPSDPDDPETNTCAPSALVRGTCCFADGSCAITDSDPIACPLGSFNPTTQNCSTAPCETCCIPGSTPGAPRTCQRVVQGACAAFSGDLTGGTCVPHPCDDEPGSCCFLGATPCESAVTADECRLSGGRFKVGSDKCAMDCALLVALGACCRPNGTCSELTTATECTSFGGTFHTGADCATLDPPCPQFGACCTETGNCSLALADDCALGGGYFAGPNTLCSGDACPTGACCIDEVCSELLSPACTVHGGSFRGSGTTCDPGTVACGDTPGACCLEDGECIDVLPQECLDRAGFFNGSGTSCGLGESCQSGACCLFNGLCEARFDFQCPPADGTFAGPGSLCSETVCVVGDCTGDGLVDLADHLKQAACLTTYGGPEQAIGDECRCVDLDRDSDVDLHDVSALWPLFTSP